MDARDPIVVGTDLAVGVLLLLIALLATSRSRGTAVLLAALAASWLAGFVWPGALFWHRAVLVHVVLAFPGVRPRGSVATAATAAAYGVSVFVPVLWLDDRATVVLALLLPLVAAWTLRGTHGLLRRRRRWALAAAALFAAILLGIAVARLGAGGRVWFATLAAYDTAVVCTALVLLLALQEVSTRRIADLVVDLGELRAGPLSDALGRALGDPELRVGWWDARRGRYADRRGVPVADTPAPGRALTRIDRDGCAFIVLEHDVELADHERLHAALETAGRLTADNVAWRAEVADRAEALADSRRRLVEAGDQESARLAQEVHREIEPRLEQLTTMLDERVAGSGHLRNAAKLLRGTRQDLQRLTAGLRPASLAAGLEPALHELARDAPIDVDLHLQVGDLPEDVEVTAYFLCAEALSNVAKHAAGSRAEVRVVHEDARFRVEVTDRGPGGARLAERGGLAGLRDRVEALGGVLTVDSGATGTRVRGVLPLG